MRIPIWTMDDAAPDAENLRSAVDRIFGKKVAAAIKEIPEADQGDAFTRRFTVEIVSSYPGASGIYMVTEEPPRADTYAFERLQ